jgi:hypothetical protein
MRHVYYDPRSSIHGTVYGSLLRGIDTSVDDHDNTVHDQLAVASSLANIFDHKDEGSLLSLLGDYLLPSDTGTPDQIPRNNASFGNPALSAAASRANAAAIASRRNKDFPRGFPTHPLAHARHLAKQPPTL